MTAYCLNLLGRQLGPLKQAEAAGRLVPQVGALHARIQLDKTRPLAVIVKAGKLACHVHIKCVHCH